MGTMRATEIKAPNGYVMDRAASTPRWSGTGW
jgi:hypothetical protein